jgi:hypothetical protein
MYEKYPLLWNIKHKDYCNIKLKDEIFKSFYSELESQGLVERMDEKQLKAKIKNIKDVYRNELAKIEKSRKSGSGTDDIYYPKLVWFDQANFFREVLSTRNSQSNLVSFNITSIII